MGGPVPPSIYVELFSYFGTDLQEAGTAHSKPELPTKRPCRGIQKTMPSCVQRALSTAGALVEGMGPAPVCIILHTLTQNRQVCRGCVETQKHI